MSTTETKELRAIKTDIVEIADSIKKDLTIEAPAGGNTVAEGTVAEGKYLELLTANTSLTKENLEELQEFNTKVVAGLAYAVGTASNDLMKKNKTLGEVNVVMPTVGKDKMEANYVRTKEVSNGIKDEEGKIGRKQAYGKVQVGFTNYATGSRGQYAVVKEHLEAAAADLFS